MDGAQIVEYETSRQTGDNIQLAWQKSQRGIWLATDSLQGFGSKSKSRQPRARISTDTGTSHDIKWRTAVQERAARL